MKRPRSTRWQSLEPFVRNTAIGLSTALLLASNAFAQAGGASPWEKSHRQGACSGCHRCWRPDVCLWRGRGKENVCRNRVRPWHGRPRRQLPDLVVRRLSRPRATKMQANPVFRSLNRPLTILGAERKLFFFALVMGACVFNLLNSLAGAVGIFFALYLFARWATRTDPQILRFLLNSTKIRTQYDPMKFEPVQVRRLDRV